MKHLDCRGLACPQPVLHAKKALEQSAPLALEIMVDNKAAVENLTRYLATQGYEVSHEARGADFLVRAAARAVAPEPGGTPDKTEGRGRNTLILITAQLLGRGDDELGQALMKNFLLTLPETAHALWRICLLNGGVKLAISSSPVLPDLLNLERLGVQILVCGACLTHYGLLEQRQVGQTTNMLDIVTSMEAADKIISL